MVRIAYRTSSGIYGPKDNTFPRAVDVETQLKRGRIREHSLKKCISVLLVVVAFCMCGLIIGLLSTCEDLEEEIKDDSTLKPITVGTGIQRTKPESVDIETTKDFTVTSSTSDVTTSPALSELDDETTLQEDATTLQEDATTLQEEDATGTSVQSTTVDLEITENINETLPEEDSTTESENNTTIFSSVSLVLEYNEVSTVETLANVKENVPTCYPPHFDPKDSSSVLKPELPGALGSLQKQSEAVRQIHATTANTEQLERETENEVAHRPVAQSITTPMPVTVQSEPVVKVSFVTSPPAVEFNKK